MRSLKNILAESLVCEAADKDTVRELTLYFENNSDLWKRAEALINAMLKKEKRGTELSEDYLAKSSVIDSLVRDTIKAYTKEFGLGNISTETRKALKAEFANTIMGRLDDYRN